MFEQPKITIVLLNYKRPKNIHIILDAIKNQTVKSTVFLWNNGSENVQSPLIDRYVQSDENVGCMARWKMAKEATTTFVMSLDDDVNFNRKDVLENIIHTLENQDNPNRIIGSTGVCFGRIPFYSIRNEFLCSYRDENKKSRIFNKGKIKNTNGEIEDIRKSFILQDTAVDIIKGRMMAFRRELLNDIDLPEEREDDIFLCATFANGKRRSHLVPALLNDAFYELPTYGVGNWLQQGHFSSRNRAIRTYFSTSKALDNQIIRYIFLMVYALKILLMKMFMLLKEVLNFIIRAKKAFQTKFFKEKIVRVSTLLHRTLFFIYKQFLRLSYCNKKKSVTILCEEFFDSKLRGYGGFGKTTLNLCKHFNNNKLQHNVCLTTRLAISEKPSIQRWHNTDVLFLSPENASRWRGLRLLSSFRPALFITIEYYPSYNFPLLLLNKVPLIIYIRDPRGHEEWKKLATVPLELRQRNVNSKEDLINYAEQKAQAMKELINSKRKIIFASNAPFLIDRAKKTYGIEFNTHPLNNPIPFPEISKIEYADKPLICWIGRLDAQKRFWIVFEIAKRCPHIEFVMLGQSQRPDIMASIIEKGKNIPNLKMHPVDDDRIKDQTYRNCWALLNTSIHEGYPVTFQEAFSYGKPVISSVNAGSITEKYGYYTGEILGEGVREEALNKFCNKIEECISNNELRLEKGKEALAYVRENHSFELYEKQLKEILQKEGIPNIFNTVRGDWS